AADVTQEAFLKAFRGLKGYRGGSFKAWILRIVTNACYDHLRSQQRRPSDSLEAMLEESPDHSLLLREEGESPDEYLLRAELSDVIQAGIATLPPDQRIVLVLSDILGFSYQEIAEIATINLGTVKSRLSRAREKLRAYLLEHEELLPAAYRLEGAQGRAGSADPARGGTRK
ncbi:MAG: sigma-70 family RNA polymerase sigma factor, partial [Anaerolineae bacterium]|nr:sigma-70 family RNA polymerase sigma factor [Anaerolineae bacterium]